jgi:hypothetical protein
LIPYGLSGSGTCEGESRRVASDLAESGGSENNVAAVVGVDGELGHVSYPSKSSNPGVDSLFIGDIMFKLLRCGIGELLNIGAMKRSGTFGVAKFVFNGGKSAFFGPETFRRVSLSSVWSPG